MDISNFLEMVIVLGLVVVVLFVLPAVLAKERKRQIEEYKKPFFRVFSKGKFSRIEADSINAGKENCPFIGKPILDTINSGVLKLGDKILFERVGDCDERPKW